MLIFLGIVFFILLVVLHEWGHFIVARRNGVKAEEFGVGFPPKIWKIATSKHPDKTEYTLNLLPLGGFVRLKGEYSEDNRPQSYGAASLWVKAKITLAGVTMNIITAFVLFTILALTGMPHLVDNQFGVDWDSKSETSKLLVSYVVPGSPAEDLGLKPGNEIVSIDGKKLTSEDDLKNITSDYAGKTISLEYKDKNGDKTEQVVLDEKVNNGYLGAQIEDDLSVSGVRPDSPSAKAGLMVGDKILQFVGDDQTSVGQLLDVSKENASSGIDLKIKRGEEEITLYIEKLNEFNDTSMLGVGPVQSVSSKYGATAPIVGLGTTVQMTALTFHGLWQLGVDLFDGDFEKAGESVTGPVGVVNVLSDFSVFGIAFILYLIAIISIALAVMNALPIPPLDGGRFAVTALFKAFKKPLTKKTEEKILGSGYLLLIALIILITIIDIGRI